MCEKYIELSDNDLSDVNCQHATFILARMYHLLQIYDKAIKIYKKLIEVPNLYGNVRCWTEGNLKLFGL